MKVNRVTEDDLWRGTVATFARKVSGGAWVPYPWLVAVLREIESRIMAGDARVILNAPPRHGKSEAIAHWLPAWYLNTFPQRRVILGTYGDDLASDWGMKVKDKFTNSELTWTRLRKDKQRNDHWLTQQGGGMRSMGVGGSVTGRGGDLVIIDDPHKDWQEATSTASRKRVIAWFNATLYTRLEPKASIIVMQTRWHENDLTGYLLSEHADNWVHIRLPALAESGPPGDFLKRREGAALCPPRFSAAQLETIRAAMGSQLFAGLYQQRPAPLEGNLVRRDWFRRYTDMPRSFDVIIQSWDMNFKETDSGSYVVGQVWGRKGGNFYLLDQSRGRWSFVETQRHMMALSTRWKEARDKLVEEAANGSAIISSLHDVLPGIIPTSAKNSKAARLAAVSGMIESGNVYIPDNSIADWADDFVEEVCGFPYAMNDDQVDAMTQALNRLYQGVYIFDLTIPSSGVRSNPWGFALTH